MSTNCKQGQSQDGSAYKQSLEADINNGFAMMQHLINEMDKSSQRIDEFNTEEFGAAARPPNDKHHIDLLYDEAWKSEDSDVASLKEVPVDFFDKDGGDSGCEDAVTSAIAEVSKDFLAGLRAGVTRNQSGDSDSNLSSDTDFKLIKGMPSYARYPETAAGLSDNDWNPYGTESDTNVSPRIPSQETPGTRMSSSKLSAMISFNPPLHSTDLDAVTPSSAICSIPNTCAKMQRIQEISEQDKVVPLNPDVTADFSSISQVSEQTLGLQVAPPEFVRVTDLNKTMRDIELESFAKSTKTGIASLQKELGDLQKSHLEPSGKSTATSGSKSSLDYKTLEGSYISVMDRAKMIGVPGAIVDGNANFFDDSQDTKASNDIDIGSCKPDEAEQCDFSDDDDHLGRKIKKVLQDTRYLDKEQKEKKTISEVAIDYSTLQRDLQEIQDSLNQNFGSGAASSVAIKNMDAIAHTDATKCTPPSSDNDGDIIPSTTTTPDRKRNRMAWDFAGDLGNGQLHGHMEEISLNTYGNSSSSQRPPTEKQSYNSDGDDTRTSGSSDKIDDHAAADQALAEMSAILRPHRQLMMTAGENSSVPGINSAQDVDDMLSNFRDQRRELESRYQQLTNPGLADKVFRILTNQDPEAQADGILSQVRSQEREERARYALNLHTNKDFNFSTTDTDNLNATNQSFCLPDDVRKRLDLSGLSSADGSKLADKSSFLLPSSKGFTAFDDMTKFLSSQMAKVYEKTFNNSLEMRIPPQVATCFPLLADNKDREEKEKRDEAAAPSASFNGGQPATDLFSGHPQEGEPTATSSPITLTDENNENGNKGHSSPEDSDSGSEKRKEKYRPYRPPGSKDFYYTESDAASIADSITTIESTHIGSDDAKGPLLPSSVLGSRKDPLSAGGIYAKHKPLISVPEGATLPPIQEKSISDDRESETNLSSKGNVGRDNKILSEKEASSKTKDNVVEGQRHIESEADDGIHVHPSFSASALTGSSYNKGVAAARRDAKWENLVREKGQDPPPTHHARNIEETFAKFNELSDLGSTRTYYEGHKDIKNSERRQQSYKQSSDHVPTRDFNREEPLSLRVKMTYTDHIKDRQESKEGRDLYGLRERDNDAVEGRERYKDYEESSRDTRSQQPYADPTRSSYFHNDEDPAVRRQNWDQDSYMSPVRDARLSPAFHHALSADLRQAIEARSPLLSQNIKRSLAQAPLEVPSRHLHDDKDGGLPRRSASPPPTFLAREKGQPPRDYACSPRGPSRRSPTYAANIKHAWTEQIARSPNQHIRDISPPPYQSNPRSPPSSNQNMQARSASPSSISRDHLTRPLSPTYQDLTPARELTLQSSNLDERVQNKKPASSPISSQRTQAKNIILEKPLSNQQQAPSPQRHVERTLENMTSESEDTEIDKEPLSRRAQMLTAALPQDRDISPDINTLWDRFKALNESHDSSMDSSRIEAITDLLRNPSKHLIAQYLKEREEYRIERQERAEFEREKRLKEQQAHPSLGMTQYQHHSSSEDDLKGGYIEMLAQKEEERVKRRAAKKKKGKSAENIKTKNTYEEEKDKENIPDSLFSIPEDASSSNMKFQKTRSHHKLQQEDHVIDPFMEKLREKISKQRGKIDKQTLKEFQRIEKLKKLEHLLSAKKHGKIGEQTLDAQLGEMSSTSTPGSNSSTENDNANGNSHSHSAPLSEDSTTAKDSSAEMHAWKAEKERRMKEIKSIEMEKRKEFKSRYNSTTKEMDKNMNRKSSNPFSKRKSHHSEMKLLKLVNEGYLTPEEAYRLAVERAQHKTKQEDISISSYSSSDDQSFSSRPHHLYSPYARLDESREGKPKHVPKLKQLSPTTFAESNFSQHTLFQGRHQKKWGKQDHFQLEDKGSMRRPMSPKKWHSQDNKGQLRTSSQSPSFRSGSSAVSFKSHSPPGLKNPTSGRSGYSPSRKYIHHSHHHKNLQNNGEGRYLNRYNSLQNRQGEDRTQSPKVKGVSWHIPIDVHPSKWEEPQPPELKEDEPKTNMHSKVYNNTVKTQDRGRTKKRVQLPLPEPSPALEEGQEPLQHWEKWTGVPSGGFWQKSDHPQGIPQEVWEEVVSQDALASKANHWDVDPLMDKVQYILNKESPSAAEEGLASRMTLQEAFLARKQVFISKCRERQKRIALSRENRHLQECLRLEREAIFADQERPVAPNLYAHPCSDVLHFPEVCGASKQFQVRCEDKVEILCLTEY
ncbi:Alstrom syndrome protein 1 [Plakobranchus ocellatus]|uniref:Alstrom syndrome protein 1 n=1 Tax=Plakobranchus ocellatus TaxID=259542 RepID=A0AAV4CYJ3_9GAST|nr:Alstrom syndrome protein 1 [Plakobranchus ocellatus]